MIFPLVLEDFAAAFLEQKLGGVEFGDDAADGGDFAQDVVSVIKVHAELGHAGLRFLNRAQYLLCHGRRHVTVQDVEQFIQLLCHW